MHGVVYEYPFKLKDFKTNNLRNDDFWLRRPLRSTRVVSIDIVTKPCLFCSCLFVYKDFRLQIFPAEFRISEHLNSTPQTASRAGRCIVIVTAVTPLTTALPRVREAGEGLLPEWGPITGVV